MKTLKHNLDNVVYETICEGFVGGHFTTGVKLDPAELSEMYQVSKTPVVQALKRLNYEGICEVTQGGKYYIPVASEARIHEICETRLLFEESAVVKLCEDCPEETMRGLEAQKDRCTEAFENKDYDKYFKEDLRFHKELVKTLHNQYTALLYNILVNNYMIIRATAGKSLNHSEEGMKEHNALLLAIKAGSKADAKRIIDDHISKLEKRIQVE